MKRNLRLGCALAMLVAAALFAGPAAAEPYLAVRQGLACSACHVNFTGAGMRTPFGNVFAEQQLPATPLPDDAIPWNGTFAGRFAVGANARVAARQPRIDGRDDTLDFGVDRVALYLGADLGSAYLYVDQQVAPGGALSREAWIRLRRGDWYVKAGRMFLPFGWRLQDDTALVREASGVSLNQGDDGLELGLERAGLSWQLAVVNGNGGGTEVDDGKLFSTRAALIRRWWQGGVSALRNDTDLGDRTAGGVFLGLATGPVSWLAEVDRIEDRTPGEDDQQENAGLLEANVALAAGHNLKLTLEGRFFDDDRENRYRASVVYEYFPQAFVQLRFGIRARDSDDADPVQSGDETFLQLHAFF